MSMEVGYMVGWVPGGVRGKLKGVVGKLLTPGCWGDGLVSMSEVNSSSFRNSLAMKSESLGLSSRSPKALKSGSRSVPPP